MPNRDDFATMIIGRPIEDPRPVDLPVWVEVHRTDPPWYDVRYRIRPGAVVSILFTDDVDEAAALVHAASRSMTPRLKHRRAAEELEREERRENHATHDPYPIGSYGPDVRAPEVILDRNGVVVLELCRRCGAGEVELLERPCDAS